MLGRHLVGLSVVVSSLVVACGGGGSGGNGGTGAGTGTETGTGTWTGTGTETGTGTGGQNGACGVFLPSSPWNTDISGAAVDARSAAYIQTINAGSSTGNLHADFGSDPSYGIPFQDVTSAVTKSTVTFDYADESDPGPYPIPANPLIEGGGDMHLLMVQTDTCVLYELYGANQQSDGWHAGSGAIWDLKTNAARPKCWTSADAAGLPIYPGLARYDEVAAGEIKHALRFTVKTSQAAFVAPATHFASNNTSPDQPPMGLRLRLKAGYDISKAGTQAKVILAALKKYGMIVADNGTSLYISGAPDPRWNDDDLNFLKGVPGDAFEAIETGPLSKAADCP
jgi:hypothetical protein